MEGVSLVPAFSGKPLQRREPIFFAHEGNCGVRSRKWKVVKKFKGPWELYDIEADRTEQHNLIDDEPEVADSSSANGTPGPSDRTSTLGKVRGGAALATR